MGDEPIVEPAESLVGAPDPFQRLWTPHRMAYIAGENKPADEAAKVPSASRWAIVWRTDPPFNCVADSTLVPMVISRSSQSSLPKPVPMEAGAAT